METEKKQTGAQGRGKRRGRSKKQSKAKGASKDKAKKGGNKSGLLPEQNRKPFHSNLPQLPVKKIHEPKETCVICGEVIEGIASALIHPDGGFCHFDCVLEKIREQENLTPSQKVSYIGKGTFAVVNQEENGSFSFAKKIVWESSEAFQNMKRYVEESKK